MKKRTDTKTQILKILAEPGKTATSQSQLAQTLGIDQSTVSEHLKDLEESGLIEVDRSPNANDIKELTREGYRRLFGSHGGTGPIPENQDQISIHKRWVGFKLRNPEALDDCSWVERWAQGRPIRHMYLPESDSYKVYTENFRFRITNRHVFVYLGEIKGSDPHHLKNRTMVEALEAAEWIESNSPVKVTRRPCELEIWMNQQHVSFIGHPLALLVDSIEGLSMSDIKVYDSKGRERLKMDRSHGPELESELPEFGEEDIQHEVDRLKSQCERPERHKWLYSDLPEEFKSLRDRVKDLEGQLKEQRATRDTNPGPQRRTLEDEFNITSTWLHCGGHLMGWAEELGRPVKLVDSSDMPGGVKN